MKYDVKQGVGLTMCGDRIMSFHMKTRSPEYKRRKHLRQHLKASLLRTQYLTENGPCVKCGSWERLELDHVVSVPAVNNRISQKLWRWSKTRREAELAKCQVLCRHCHRAKTAIDNKGRNHTKIHGRGMYERHGCRCDLCRAVQAERKRRYRANLKTKVVKEGEKGE